MRRVKDDGTFPTGVKVGAFNYRVVKWRSHDASSCGRIGEADHLNLVIRVDEELALIKAAEVLLHEIFHAVFRVWNIDKDKNEEEQIVSSFGNGTATVIADNPGVLRWIQKALK